MTDDLQTPEPSSQELDVPRISWPRTIAICIAIPAVVFLVTFLLADWGITTFGAAPWTVATALLAAVAGWAGAWGTRHWWLRVTDGKARP